MTATNWMLRCSGAIVPLVILLASQSTPSHVFSAEDQKRLCTGDVLRLCFFDIPDVDRITACMRKQRPVSVKAAKASLTSNRMTPPPKSHA